ncbi:hypothetical protein Slin15195_G127090 [Septoria linicola]|uniref:Uncharacterized protein n=1 Tax=Septoria linicola TaxID=215465 RepID=A0A9Q9B2D8_9PEZI|nr:hypothetical protein Slin14017_G083260 [Septoria linicola]USW59390.1 hypothetical protein Slin15195_G127090 [Septoria linicola]
MASPQVTILVVAEDSEEFLVTIQDANGEQQAPQWVSKFTLPGSLDIEWQARKAQADKLYRQYQSEQTMMEAFGTSFINIYHKGTLWSIFDEPAELPLMAALTSKYPGGVLIRLATTVDQAGWQAYATQLGNAEVHVPPPSTDMPGQLSSSPASVSHEMSCNDLQFPHEAGRLRLWCDLPTL